MAGPDSVVPLPGIGTIAQLWNLARTTPDSNSTIDAQIAAARAAGYTGNRATLIAVGQGIVSADAFALGQGGGPGADRMGPMRIGPTATANLPAVIPQPPNLPAVIPQPPPVFSPPSVYYPLPEPPSPGGSGSSGIPPQPPRSSPPINPNSPPQPVPVPVIGVSWPLIVTSVLGPYVVPAATQAGQAAWDWIKAGRPLPKGPKTRRPRTPHRGPGPKTQADQGNPFPAQGPPPVTVIVNMPRQPAEPKPPKKRPNPMAGLGPIFVSRARLPVPRPPPAPPPPKPLWLTLLPILGPSLLGFIRPAQGNRTVVRLTDPLTRPVTDGNPFPLTGVQTSVQNYSSFGPPGGGAGTQQCECKTPRKKGRKKKRTVCYSGTFTEKASGIRKVKKRKVACT